MDGAQSQGHVAAEPGDEAGRGHPKHRTEQTQRRLADRGVSFHRNLLVPEGGTGGYTPKEIRALDPLVAVESELTVP